MYNDTGGNKQCERKTNTCFYSFSMKNLNTSQTGTYYCAVAACGHILFGNGTTLVCEDSQSRVQASSSKCRGLPRGKQPPLCSFEENQPNRSMQNRQINAEQTECVYSAVRL
ncbi:hypothetical protein D4764_0197170 [Takifugu flavidus]|uniref:Immunoglobulin V-set domain-containing protein n=1 Tax=Takifugu flavidus TaxID=433684 RepID=A0A5C6MH68_9TELE|nr:hypothetical protein D4764_0197170 [Takifugu flavidus]